MMMAILGWDIVSSEVVTTSGSSGAGGAEVEAAVAGSFAGVVGGFADG